ncbi:MAG: hypothetical protein WCR79_08325 [Fusobacterium sp.]
MAVETEEEKVARLKKEKEDKEKADKAKADREALIAEITKSVQEGQSEKYTKLEQEIQKYKDELTKLQADKNPAEKDKKPNTNENTEVMEANKKILAQIKKNEDMYLSMEKEKIKTKYGLADEDFANITEMEQLKSLDKTYSIAFEKAKTKFTSNEEMVKILNEKKKTIIDIDNSIGDPEVKEKAQADKTAQVLKFLNIK